MKPECKKEYYDNGNVRYEDWLLNGNPHREDGPAIIWYYENGNISYESWYLNSKLHRKDDPAIIYYYENGNVESEDWFLNGERHREDGPAYIWYYEDGNVRYERWYLNGKYIFPKDHLIEIPKEELGKLIVLKKLVFIKVDNEYVFIKHWLRKDKEFYNKYKILF